ncbi:MAG: TIGR03435 family protein [Candidatus Acidiferrales bacterium]
MRGYLPAAIAGIAALAVTSLMGATSAPATRAEPQSQNAAPAKYEYDVVSIRVLDPDDNTTVPGTGYSPNGLTATRVRMWWMFRMAYDVPRAQIVGAPNWVDDLWFNLEARLDGETAAELQKLSSDELRVARQQMLRAVMADRFGLKFHWETRELPAYFLTIAKDGPKLQEEKRIMLGNSTGPTSITSGKWTSSQWYTTNRPCLWARQLR